ncbi:YolD-like family protein [Bacillus sp. LBG-1-113]|uniref:YolD-like family protein n=1 Tax=Bacillus sp. LBG-1-113 TaxID=2886094 RepID=UPI001E463C5D|nr:YolD-like family protein [Bacillus sp. LBG-1-113]
MLGTDLSFDLYHDGYIREVIGAVHYVDHPRKELRVNDLKGDTWFIEFDSLLSVRTYEVGR